jgi:hypothetical protein
VTGTGTGDAEYRIERLRERLAQGRSAELGLRIEACGQVVTVCGTVADAECREAVRRAVEETLAGLTVHVDLQIAATDALPQAEELS